MKLFVNSELVHNLKRGFKLGIRQVIERLEGLGFSLAGYSQANSYSLEHGYFTVYFNQGNTWLKLDCSNDEQFPIVISHCLKHDLLFVPITEILRIKSDSAIKQHVLAVKLIKLGHKIDHAVTETKTLDAMLDTLVLSRDRAYQIARNCVSYRNYKLKSDRVFSVSFNGNAREFFYTLLKELLTSQSRNADNGLLSNIRQVANVTKYVRNQFEAV